ncbi:MAG: carboxyl transferase domain-containing protein, partial [Pseudomonadota bacterium]
MHPYFKNMPTFGKALSDKKKAKAEDNKKSILEVEAKIAEEILRVKNAGLPAEKIHSRGQLTIWDRIEKLVDPGTFRPLHILFNPKDNEEGTTGVVDGLAKIEGKWCVLAGFDNKVMAGAWIAGQAENQLRITDLAKRLHIPLVWLVNCSGVKLTEQEEVYADRRGNGTTFFRHAELETKGIPILAGIWGTNPAGGGYQGISPTYLIAHKDCNIAVGGGGIVGGMSPKGGFDVEGAEQLIEATRHFKEVPPGSVGIHYDKTGFFKEVHDTEEGVLNSIRRHMTQMPAYDLDFFRVDEPKEPIFPADDLYYLVNFNQKMSYDFDQCLARLVDGSEHMEFKPGYGPEVYTGLVKLNGLVMGVIGNRQGFMPPGYPEYAGGEYMGIGGKLYRQGLIKMNEFVTLCGRDRVPIIWFQDTSGIDVG